MAKKPESIKVSTEAVDLLRAHKAATGVAIGRAAEDAIKAMYQTVKTKKKP